MINIENSESESLFEELDDADLMAITGGVAANYDLNTYLLNVGAGAIFDGDLIDRSQKFAFKPNTATNAGIST